MLLVEYDDMVDTLSTDRTDQAFHIRVLPGRAIGDDDLLDAHVLDAIAKVLAVNCVSVTNQKARRFVEREGFHGLLGCPPGKLDGQ